MKFEDLPLNIRKEMLDRHSHAEIQNDLDPEQIVYKEQDVIDLMEIYAAKIKAEYEECHTRYNNQVGENFILVAKIKQLAKSNTED